ncbi:MAG: septal ring lytic transglycosylase RlpA family protein [Prevotellaceae bacterium]|jgi:rare lipoprotein A|nr:septal ring lytic transglycosylase RlpA family protein [Prevotellaceae bacterium]MDY3855878.1 septal ring lytic transglycosylase RlpA family protein [Bacteroidaceae bacterium]
MAFRKILLLFVAMLSMTDFALAQSQRGKATYYSRRSHGCMTASGTRIHRDSFTCAHRTLPFGTILKVRDTRTNKEIYVKVTDRGPYVRGRIVDLSYAAAKELGMIGRGVTNVEITTVKDMAHVPYKAGDDLGLPQLKVKDPLGKGYCSLSQWGERYNKKKINESMARAGKTRGTNVVGKAKRDSVPRWRILHQLTAQDAETVPQGNGSIIVK